MDIKQIIFTAANVAELMDVVIDEPKDDEIMVKLEYTTISAGTERANLIGDLNVNAAAPCTDTVAHFPRTVGYSGAGVVYKVGKDVKNFKVGDKVCAFNGKHASYWNYKESMLVKIPTDEISFSEASMAYISTFPMAAVRKMKPELGESAIVMGLGILGIFAVQFLKAAGIYPVIAVDPIKEKRDFALTMGADVALDPTETDFSDKVKELTEGGAHIAIEVTGLGKGFDQALDCMRKYGRVALLGCTRSSDFTIDYYRKIHFPGITVVGAHTCVRPEQESFPNYWTHVDDIKAIFKLIRGKRVNYKKMVSEIHSPNEAYEVFTRLATEKTFPSGVQFDWSRLEN